MSDHNRSEVGRREFLQAGAAVTAASALTVGNSSTVLAQDKAAKSILPTRKLGKTGVDVTILNVGTGGWRGLGGAAPLLLRTAYANGIRYLDTANAYGTEPAIANFFKLCPRRRRTPSSSRRTRPRPPSR